MPVGGLYEARVPVESQSDSERRQALPKAMWQILVKLTGDTGIVDDERAKPLINDAERFVQQYRFLEPEVSGEAPWLWVSFDPDAVDAALRQAGVPTWGKERPATLVWLAVDDAPGERLVGMEQDSEYLRPLTRQARDRGLPLLLPLMDLEDTTRLQPADIQAGSISALREASARYPADVVLAVSLSGVETGEVSARWTMLPEEDSINWRNTGESRQAVLSEGIDRLAEYLAGRYAPTGFSAGETRIELRISAIDSLEDYARAQNYLTGLSSVSRVDVKQVMPGEVIFEVETLAGESALEQAIAIGRTLRAESGGRNYRLLP